MTLTKTQKLLKELPDLQALLDAPCRCGHTFRQHSGYGDNCWYCQSQRRICRSFEHPPEAPQSEHI